MRAARPRPALDEITDLTGRRPATRNTSSLDIRAPATYSANVRFPVRACHGMVSAMARARSARRRDASRVADVEPTLEDRLHWTYEDCHLLADLFQLQSHTARVDEALSSAATSALARLCGRASVDIRGLLDTLPIEMLNWTVAQKRPRGRTSA